MNPTDGTIAEIGATGYQMTFGLAYDPLTDTIYGVGRQNVGDTANLLLEIDRTNGSVTPIGDGIEGLLGTSGLAFDPIERRVIAFGNTDDLVVAFELNGTATQLSDLDGITTFGLTYTNQGFVYSGFGTTPDPNDIDPDTNRCPWPGRSSFRRYA
ncbi:MAG: hypothetical protein KDA84_17765 [Planctomycetaceae bacterium]|nr:hypothetical protein [Planctomycetaceae bacterium]